VNSLWLRNVATGSDAQVVPHSANIPSVAFSPDGNYIYFLKAENAITSDFNLYRTPVLGGMAKAVISDVDSGVTFSPDGQRMAYIRGNDPEAGKYRLLSTNLDGSDEKVLLRTTWPSVRSLCPQVEQSARRQTPESWRSGGCWIPCFSVLYISVLRLMSR